MHCITLDALRGRKLVLPLSLYCVVIDQLIGLWCGTVAMQAASRRPKNLDTSCLNLFAPSDDSACHPTLFNKYSLHCIMHCSAIKQSRVRKNSSGWDEM